MQWINEGFKRETIGSKIADQGQASLPQIFHVKSQRWTFDVSRDVLCAASPRAPPHIIRPHTDALHRRHRPYSVGEQHHPHNESLLSCPRRTPRFSAAHRRVRVENSSGSLKKRHPQDELRGVSLMSRRTSSKVVRVEVREAVDRRRLVAVEGERANVNRRRGAWGQRATETKKHGATRIATHVDARIHANRAFIPDFRAPSADFKQVKENSQYSMAQTSQRTSKNPQKKPGEPRRIQKTRKKTQMTETSPRPKTHTKEKTTNAKEKIRQGIATPSLVTRNKIRYTNKKHDTRRSSTQECENEISVGFFEALSGVPLSALVPLWH